MHGSPTEESLLTLYHERVLPALVKTLSDVPRRLGPNIDGVPVFALAHSHLHGASHYARVAVLALSLAYRLPEGPLGDRIEKPRDAFEESVMLAALFHD